jgi:hypothetical protein
LKEFFGETSFVHLSIGLIIVADDSEEKEIRLTHNMQPNPSNGELVAHLSDAIRSREEAENESLMESFFNSNSLFSAAANPLFSLELSLAELLAECRAAYNWPAAPDRLMLVSVKAPVEQEATTHEDSAAQLNRYLAQDMRWLERHTLDLLRQHRMLYFDGMGEVKWPAAFELERQSAITHELGKLPKPLPEMRRDLEMLLMNDDLDGVITAMQDLLPEGSDKKRQVISVKSRLNSVNKENVRGTVSREQYEVSRNRIRADLFDLINSLEDKDFAPAKAKSELLSGLRNELQELLVEDLPVAIQKLKDSLPEGSEGYNQVTYLERRLNDMNKMRLRDTMSREEYQIRYNQITSDLLDLIDKPEEIDFSPTRQTKSNQKSGHVLYRIPSKMTLHKEEVCEVRIANNEDVLLKSSHLDEHVSIQSLPRISEIMSVEILDPEQEPAFRIRTISESVQFIDEEDYTEWKFYVTRLREWGFPLLLKIATIETIDGRERKRETVIETQIGSEDDDVPPTTAASPKFK